MLDRTCFHPQGGGQPADRGTLKVIDSSAAFDVAMVKKDTTGVARHDGPSEPPFTAGVKVLCEVDGPFRQKNARVHSAGHLIDVAMTNSGCTLRPTKGYHFTPGAYVEYDGKLEASARDALLPKLQASLDQLIAQAVPTVVHSLDAQRVVSVGGQECPCGGTHVLDTKQLGSVKVDAVKTKGKVTRVSYTVSE